MKLPILALLYCAFTSLLHATEPPPVLDKLQKLWREELSKQEAFKVHEPRLAKQLFENERIVVRDAVGDEVAKRIERNLPAGKRSLILTGDLAALRAHPQVTEVYNPGTHRGGFAAYFAPDGGLLLLWIVPEG